jgi:regulator of protease activity HflC (stomatin/prohibitin superfamily)
MIRERERHVANGLVAFPVLFLTSIAVFWLFYQAVQTREALPIFGSIFLILLQTVSWLGFFSVGPNEGRVLQLFGSYRGTVRDPGLRYANPLYSKKKISLRVRNFESAKLKVNDNIGNPIEIASIVVWRVVDTAEAIFQVDDYQQFVKMQTEAALRSLASAYAYDTFEEGSESLRSHPSETNNQLKTEVQARLEKAGVEVIEARISHLAYAPEIAGAMLQRQQATAIIAARRRIVDGAVGMVEMALDELSKKNMVDLDQERKAAMVSNLLVVLCGDRAGVQPVLNTGTLYH